VLPGEVPWPGLIPTDPAASPLGRTEAPYIYPGYSAVMIGVSGPSASLLFVMTKPC